MYVCWVVFLIWARYELVIGENVKKPGGCTFKAIFNDSSRSYFHLFADLTGLFIKLFD